MSSQERLAIIGLIQKLKDDEKKLCVKIEGAAELVRTNCSTVLNTPYDQMRDDMIEVYSGELVQAIRDLRAIKERIKKAESEIT